MEDKIQVYIRLKPYNIKTSYQDKENDSSEMKLSVVNNQILIEDEFENRRFFFDSVFSQYSTQEAIFNTSTKKIIDSVIDGYNGTVLAYGQTGSGKTYTIFGDIASDKEKGIIPRALGYIFSQRVKRMYESKSINDYFNIEVSYIQIYLENLYDLFDINNTKLKLREDFSKAIYLEGSTWKTILNESDGLSLLQQGDKNRSTGKTLMNTQSSRSHAIFIVKISNCINGLKRSGTLFIVDLAGSERVAKSGADSVRLEEAKKINSSLLALGNCIQSLSSMSNNEKTYVGYRDSKLTRLLKDSLGGNSKTCLIITVSISEYNKDETISSMLFGQRARKIVNKLMQNQQELEIDYRILYEKLLEDIKLNKINQSNDMKESKKVKEKEEIESVEEFYSQMIIIKDKEIKDLKEEIEKMTKKKEDKRSVFTNTEMTFSKETVKIMEDLYNQKNIYWTIEHIEELCKILNEDNISLNSEITKQKERIRSLEKKQNANKTEINEKEKEIKDLKQYVSELETERSVFKKENEELKEENNFYLLEDKEIKRLAYELKSKSIEVVRIYESYEKMVSLTKSLIDNVSKVLIDNDSNLQYAIEDKQIQEIIFNPRISFNRIKEEMDSKLDKLNQSISGISSKSGMSISEEKTIFNKSNINTKTSTISSQLGNIIKSIKEDNPQVLFNWLQMISQLLNIISDLVNQIEKQKEKTFSVEEEMRKYKKENLIFSFKERFNNQIIVSVIYKLIDILVYADVYVCPNSIIQNTSKVNNAPTSRDLDLNTRNILYKSYLQQKINPIVNLLIINTNKYKSDGNENNQNHLIESLFTAMSSIRKGIKQGITVKNEIINEVNRKYIQLKSKNDSSTEANFVFSEEMLKKDALIEYFEDINKRLNCQIQELSLNSNETKKNEVVLEETDSLRLTFRKFSSKIVNNNELKEGKNLKLIKDVNIICNSNENSENINIDKDTDSSLIEMILTKTSKDGLFLTYEQYLNEYKKFKSKLDELCLTFSNDNGKKVISELISKDVLSRNVENKIVHNESLGKSIRKKKKPIDNTFLVNKLSKNSKEGNFYNENLNNRNNKLIKEFSFGGRSFSQGPK